MIDYAIMPFEDLQDACNAIRAKTGTTDLIKSGDMATLIRSIKATSTSTAGIDSAVAAEVERVVSGMTPKISSNSINFVAMSDTHEIGDGESQYDYVTTRIRNGNMHAGQAAKLISDRVNLDFFAHLGDFIYGSSSTTGAQGLQCFVKVKEYIHDVMKANESFLTVGNHDAMLASTSATGVSIPYSILSDIIGTYRYKDYEDKKVRVICLNTADNSATSTQKEGLSGAQLQWFANALDLSAKSDASKWGIIILSHHPLDWGGVKVAANCLATYLEGGTYSVTHGGVSVSKNFSGKNSAKIIAQFHGHVHGFKVDYINDLRTGSPVPTTVKRIAIPNACFERTNEYGENGKYDSNNIEFGETDSYEKIDSNFSKDTALCLVSIDLDNEVIYADCYGAGYDRIVDYGAKEIVFYSISNNLTNVTSSNSLISAASGSTYTAALSANSGYELSSVTVTMGGTDITSAVYSNGSINISSVTGAIVITASAVIVEDFEYGEFTNLVLSAESYDSTAVYNGGLGYKNGIYCSENEVANLSGAGSEAACVATGWIPFSYNTNNSIYIKGATLDTSKGRVRVYCYSNKGAVNSSVGYASGATINNFYTVEVLGDKYYKLTPKSNNNVVTYLRLSLIGTGENLIVTINEPIHAAGSITTYTITNNLVNATTNNSVTSVAANTSYSAKITTNSGYELSSVTVTMGGTDITSSVYSDGTISIASVTGNIIITATANEIIVAPTYTNLVPTLRNVEDTSPFNGVGYQDDKYISSTSVGNDTTGCTATGLLPYDYEHGVRTPIYIKGVTIDTSNSHCRIYGFNISMKASFQLASGSAISTYFNIETLGTNYYKITPLETIPETSYVQFFRFSFVGRGENLIITLGEPIDTTVKESYVNMIPKSVTAVGGSTIYGDDYNGDGEADGYKTGTRISSSWTETSASNMCCTGFIPCKYNDVVRIKNVTVAGGSSSYLLYYTSVGGQAASVQQSGLESALGSDGIITVTITSTAAAYLRLSVGKIDATSIITINEEIVD